MYDGLGRAWWPQRRSERGEKPAMWPLPAYAQVTSPTVGVLRHGLVDVHSFVRYLYE